MPELKLAGATVNQIPINWENNRKNILDAIAMAKKEKVDILCLPELCITGYGCEDLFLGEWIYDRAFSELESIIPHCTGITVAIGFPLAFDTRHYNTTCVVKDGRPVGVYAKQFLANDGVHYEPRWFSPWPVGEEATVRICGQDVPLGDVTFQLHGAHIGFEICEDAWRQNRPACRLVEKGVNLILNPSASHFAFHKTLLREELIVSSSLDFKCTYVYANLLGNEAGRMIYDGEILIAHHGRLAARNKWLSFQPVELLTATVDVGNPDAEFPGPREYERRKEYEFVQAESLALFDYMRKSHSQGFVLSLSGGADSSTIAVLVREMVRRGIEALGLETFLLRSGLRLPATSSEKDIMEYILTTAYQGTVNSSQSTFDSARMLAAELGATFHSWKIDDEVKTYTGKIEKSIGRPLTWAQDDITLQNIQARARSPIIWMLANINNALLLTTSNRSEGDVGYATMDGDTSGSIAPIAAVDKAFIIHWLKWAERELGYSSLSHVNNLQPSAELRPLQQTQTDEDDLMPYTILVEIEKLAIRDHMSPVEVYDILKLQNLEPNDLLKSHISKFYRLWSRNQWKRERIAPSFHLDDFNVDPRTWCRFPILSGSYTEELKQLQEA
ncbi:NAD(+) synthase [Fulvivirga sedimenti]|uniref:Glutamine-dependent NAD(+) synthetase n=1 Tax=Fulvivirga sedimenti TaxID=2879465 RepID=A0A9X1HN96_9BACT|nr:NAD(+) synthase [Fulvivirga sedimenti]